MFLNQFKNEVINKTVELTNQYKNANDDNKDLDKQLILLNKLLSNIKKYELYFSNNKPSETKKKIKMFFNFSNTI